MVTTAPAIEHAWSSFLAGGAPGYAEAAPGDHLQTGYRLWLVGHQLEHGRAPWRDPYSFRPETGGGLNPAGWPFGLPYWPLVRALGPVLAWNAFVLLLFLAAGAIACAWLREVGLSRGPALAGGLAFAVAPYRAAQSVGHLLGPISILLPLALFAFERGRRSSRWWRAALWHVCAAASLASIPFSGQAHLALGAIPFFAAYALVRTRRPTHLAGATLAVLAAVAGGVLVDKAVIAGSLEAGGRSLSEVDVYSAEWLDFVTRHHRHGGESFVFLGWGTPLVALAALVLLWREGRRALSVLLALSVAFPAVLALGTNTPVYRAVRFALPPFRYPRVPERLMPIACLAIAALVGFAVAELAERDLGERLQRATVRWPVHLLSGWRVPIVAGLAVVALLADLHVTVFGASAADPGNRAYGALRSQARGRLLELPVFLPGVHFGSVYLYYDMQARRERPGGYSTTARLAADRLARTLRPLNCGDWTLEPGPVLDELGVRAIAFHTGLYTLNPAVPGRAWFAWRELVRHGFRTLAHDGVVTTLVRSSGPSPPPPVPEPARESLHFCSGWYANDGEGWQMSEGHAPFWTYDGGDLRLFLRSDPPLRVRLSVDGALVGERLVSSLGEIRAPLGKLGWHLVSLDAAVPHVSGRPEGARLVGYAFS